jgi:cell division protein FtsB
MKKIRIDPKRLVVIGALVLGFLLLMGLFDRLTELASLNRLEKTVRSEVSQYTATIKSLYTQIAYATSEAAVEEWARQEGHMARPGDVLIVPVSPGGTTPQSVFQPTPTPQPVSNWEVWWALFFGQ